MPAPESLGVLCTERRRVPELYARSYGGKTMCHLHVIFSRFSFVSTNAVFEEDGDGVAGRSPHEIPTSTYQEGVQSRVTPGLDVDIDDEKLRAKNELLLKRLVCIHRLLSIGVL